MKTTIELPDELLTEAKATAARQGRSLRELFSEALWAHLARTEPVEPGQEAWRGVFGRVDPAQVRSVDQAVAEDLERIDPESWS